MVINRDKHNLFAARPGLSVYTTGATTSPMKTSSTSGSTIVVSGGGGSGLTDEQASKLNSIEEGAQVNQNAYSKVAVGDNTIEAANATDTIVITTDGKIVATLENGILKLEYKGNDDLWYKDEDGNLWTDANVYSTKEISAYGFKGGEAGSGARYLYELNDVSSDVETPSNGNILRYDSNLNLWTLFDAKNLEVDLTPVYDQINELDTDVDALIKNVNSISKEVATNKSNIDGNKQRITSLEQNDIILNNLFDFVDGKIRANFDFYSLGEISAYGYNDGEAGSGSSYLHELNDVLLTSLTSGQLLQWDGNNWVNVNSDEIGFDETRLNQILIDYATKAWVESKGYLTQHQDLSTYATQKWVEGKKYITSSALNGYATEKWVTDKGYAVATDVASTYATIEALNKKLDKDKFAESFATEMAKWFVKDDTNKGIKPVNSYGLYSDTYVSAKGVSTGTGGSGGSSYDRLDRWSDYTSDKAGWVLSALLGQDLNNRLSSLESGSALSLVTTGDGNAVTAITKSGNQLTVTKGSTFQSLITSSNKLAYSLISGTPTSLPASDVAAWAKAASKPSYAFSEITNKPTTLGGYGITDAYTATTIDSKLGGYLPLSGGTITGGFGIHKNNTTENPNIALSNNNGTAWLGYNVDADSWFVTNKNWYNTYTLIHSGNIGRYAIKLDQLGTNGNAQSSVYNTVGYGNVALDSGWKTYGPILTFGVSSYYTQIQKAYDSNVIYFRSYINGSYTDWDRFITSNNIGSQSVAYATSAGSANKLDGYNLITEVTDWNSAPNTIFKSSESNTANAPYAGYCYGAVLRFHRSPSIFYTDLVTNLYSDLLFYRRHSDQGYSDWKQIAFTDSNVASATKLKTARTIWGQSFDGTGNVSGHITNASSFRFSGDIGIWQGNLWSSLNTDDIAYYATRHLFWGNVGIGTTYPTEKLHVAGNIVATGSVTAKSSSDYRLKCGFDYGVDYQERLLSLGKVCDFNYTPHAQEREFAFADDKRHTSVIWQDARKANITGFCSVEEDGYGTINPLSSDLIFTMVGAIQQGIIKTEKIEERVVRLEKENRELKEKINLLEGGRYGC